MLRKLQAKFISFDAYHRFRWYATLENKTPAETFPKFPLSADQEP